MHLARTRTLFSLAFIVSVLALGGALYLEFVLGLVPCPLCRLQQWLIGLCALICLVAIIYAPRDRRAGLGPSVGLLIGALLGSYAAARQVWLQSSPPDDLVACLLALQDKASTHSSLSLLFDALFGDADCAEINWSLFGITLPEWSLLVFVGLLALAVGLLVAGLRRLARQRSTTSDQTRV